MEKSQVYALDFNIFNASAHVGNVCISVVGSEVSQVESYVARYKRYLQSNDIVS